MLEWTLAEFVLGWSESFLFFFWNWIEQGLQFPRPFGGEVRSCHWKFIKFGPNSHNQLETLQSKIPVWLCAVVQLSIWRHQTFWQLTAVLSIEQETSLGVFFAVPCSWDGDAGADRCCCQQWGAAPCLQPHFHVESHLWCMSKNKASDLSCLTALSTCPTVQIHKHLACLPSSQGSHVSLCPTSGDFWLDIADIRAHPAPPTSSSCPAEHRCSSCSPETQGVSFPTPETRISMTSTKISQPPTAKGLAAQAEAEKGRTLCCLCLFQSTFGADFQTFCT